MFREVATNTVAERAGLNMAAANMPNVDGSAMTSHDIVEFAEETGIKRLGLTKEHIMTLRTLTWRGTTREHHDPFDRMLISQAKSENMFFLTHDHLLPGYEEPCVISV